jgi:RND superfamily putative drug exporter
VRFQTTLSREPDVSLVLGPGLQPLTRRFGVAVSSTGDAARYLLFLGSDPLGARAISEVRTLDARLPGMARRAGLPQAHTSVAGDTALAADTVDTIVLDIGRVTPVVLALIFLVIAVYLRALVAPVYLVLTCVVAVLASLGLTVYMMQTLGHYGEISYYALFPVAVLLVSLGSDYNVFLVGRIWQEGRHRPLRDAVESAGARAARPIATAGLVLAASFALLAIVPLRPFREIAFAMATGLLIDTVIVRTVLVPALLALVGPRSAWPGRTFMQSARRPAADRAHVARPAAEPEYEKRPTAG